MIATMEQNTVGTISGGWHTPLAYTLRLIDRASKPEKRELLDLLATAAEFYDMGRKKGREETVQEFEDKEDRKEKS